MIMGGQLSEGVQNFRHLGALTNSKKFISDEIKLTTAAGDRCFYNLRQTFKSRAMSKSVTVKIYKR
jgi:hypothetical protein